MKKEDIENKFIKIAYILEMIVVVLIGLAVLMGFINIMRHLPGILLDRNSFGYDTFTAFLSYALLLVIGIEFILMLLTHSVNSTLNLVLFAVSRKLLIYTHSALDLVFGSLAIGILFATIKYLTPEKME